MKGPWKNGKLFAYSITFDEGLEILIEHTLPILQEFGIPAHVAVLPSQIDQKRNVPGPG